MLKFSRLVRLLEVTMHTAPQNRPNPSEFFRIVNEKFYKYHTSSVILGINTIFYF